MKRKPEADLPAVAADATGDGDEPLPASLPLSAFSGDVCAALTARYGRSAAPQHRHLLASAAAMRCILLDEGLPITPTSYLPAAFSALRAAGPSDTAAASALAAFLAILLPHVPSSSLPPPKATDAANTLAGLLTGSGAAALPTGTVRSVVKSLGHLALHLDAGNWKAVEAPLDALLASSVDRRPKVRKCARDCVEKFFAYLEPSCSIKKASTVALAMFERQIPLARGLVDSDASEGKQAANPEETEALHVLNTVAVVVKYLSKKARKKIFSEAYQLLSPCFNPITRHILKLMEVLSEHVKVDHIDSEAESLVFAIVTYMSYDEKKPVDTIVAALQLLNNCLTKLVTRPNLWTKTLPAAIEAVSGYLILDVKSSKDIAEILRECVDIHIDRKALLNNAAQLGNHNAESSCDGAAIKSICLLLNNTLSTCGRPSESILTVISVLFLKLGEISYFFMKEILLTLSQFAMKLDEESHLKHVQECIGSAVIAMGPEKILSLIPIALDEERLTCSNTWLIPILEKYIYGASLQLFLEYVVPLSRSLQNASSRGKKTRKHEDLQSCVEGLWNLLPAFCRHPSDISQNFGSLSKLLVEILKCEPCLHEPVVKALQELVGGTRRLTDGHQHVPISGELSVMFSSNIRDFNYVNLGCCSKKDARKNMKVLASHSTDLVCALADCFLDSSPEKRAYLKDALRSLASFSGGANIRSLFLSLLERFGFEDTTIESENLECQTHEVDGKEEENTKDGKDEEDTEAMEKLNNNRCLLMELISTFADTGDEDLLDLLFGFIKSSLLNGGGSCHSKALFALSTILKENNDFCLARLDEIMMLLHGIKSHLDSTVLEGQLLCFQYLLVHMLKVNEEDMNKKAFLILNEIILALKSKKETRRLAYDVLLATSSSLKNSQSNNVDSDLQRLFTMVMGYLSSPSPHIVSGAIAALSLLIYDDANFCLAVPNLIPSVLVLLQHKAIEVIKAALGFVKVLVSSVRSDKLVDLQADIVSGILPWSSVSKNHFKGKVVLILDILIRKCGSHAVDSIIPDKYKAFVKSIKEGRQGNRNGTEVAESEAQEPTSRTAKRRKKLDSDDATGQESTHHGPRPKYWGRGRQQGKNFTFRKKTGETGSRTANSKQRTRSMGKESRSNLKFKSQAQPGDNEKSKKEKSRGGNKRKMGGPKFKSQNRRVPASKHDASSRFKKRRSAATM